MKTGKCIVETFAGADPDSVSAVLVYSHGPITWVATPSEAVHKAAVLEEVAFLQWHADAAPMQRELLDRHYLRKHGAYACHGQAGG